MSARHPGRAAAAMATWDEHARRYGAQEPLEARALAAAARLAAPTAHERVVDLGTGTGALPALLARAADPPRDLTAVDRSPRMLAHAAARLPQRWRTLEGDARGVPLPDGCADVVTCAYLLHLLDGDDRAAVLAEARRLLVAGPAARLVVVTVWIDRERLAGRALGSLLGAAARARPATWGGLAPLDPTTDLAGAGFAPTRRVQIPHGGYPSLVLGARRL